MAEDLLVCREITQMLQRVSTLPINHLTWLTQTDLNFTMWRLMSPIVSEYLIFRMYVCKGKNMAVCYVLCDHGFPTCSPFSDFTRIVVMWPGVVGLSSAVSILEFRNIYKAVYSAYMYLFLISQTTGVSTNVTFVFVSEDWKWILSIYRTAILCTIKLPEGSGQFQT